MIQKTYYVVRTGPDRFDLRQTRYKGCEHPHDLMAVGFTAQAMREIIAKYFSDTDDAALPMEDHLGIDDMSQR